MSTLESATAVLRKRAAALAQPRVEPDAAAHWDVLVVTVDGRRLGLDGRYVSQVVPGRGLRRLPHGCGALVALVASRGTAVPVADLGRLLGATGRDDRAYVVLLEGEAPPVGLLVDDVHEVRTLTDRAVRAAPPAHGDDAIETGVTPDGLVLLDLARLLRDPRLHPRGASDNPQFPAVSEENHVPHDHR